MIYYGILENNEARVGFCFVVVVVVAVVVLTKWFERTNLFGHGRSTNA
jgi:hypothetical protein